MYQQVMYCWQGFVVVLLVDIGYQYQFKVGYQYCWCVFGLGLDGYGCSYQQVDDDGDVVIVWSGDVMVVVFVWLVY